MTVITMMAMKNTKNYERTQIYLLIQGYISLERIYQFSRAAVLKYHRLGLLDNKKLFSHGSGNQKSNVQFCQGELLRKRSISYLLLIFSLAIFALCLCLSIVWPSLLCFFRQYFFFSVCVKIQISSSYKDRQGRAYGIRGPP